MEELWREQALHQLTSYFKDLSDMQEFDLFTVQVAASIVARSQNILTDFANDGNEVRVGKFLLECNEEEYRQVIQQIGFFYIDPLFASDEIRTMLIPEEIDKRKVDVFLALTKKNNEPFRIMSKKESYETVLKTIRFPFTHPRLLNKLDEMMETEFEELRFTFEHNHLKLL